MTTRQGLGAAVLGLVALMGPVHAQTSNSLIEFSRPSSATPYGQPKNQAAIDATESRLRYAGGKSAINESDYVVLSPDRAQGRPVPMPAAVVRAGSTATPVKKQVARTSAAEEAARSQSNEAPYVDFEKVTPATRPAVQVTATRHSPESQPAPVEALEAVWRVQRGASLKDTLEAWAFRAGWQAPEWPAEQKDVELGANAEFNGDFAAAVYGLFKSLPANVKLRPTLYTGNKYILLEVAP